MIHLPLSLIRLSVGSVFTAGAVVTLHGRQVLRCYSSFYHLTDHVLSKGQ